MDEEQIQNTLRHLEIVRDLEDTRMEQEELLDALALKMNKLGHPDHFWPPERKEAPRADMPPGPSIGSLASGGCAGGCCGCLLYVFGGAVLAEICLSIGLSLTPSLSDLQGFIIGGAILGAFIVFAERQAKINKWREAIKR